MTENRRQRMDDRRKDILVSEIKPLKDSNHPNDYIDPNGLNDHNDLNPFNHQKYPIIDLDFVRIGVILIAINKGPSFIGGPVSF
jgi:hypothetical protein